jgi:hypothetical protein
MSVPEFNVSYPIPEPSYEFMSSQTQILALFTVDDKLLHYYWWRERRQVIIYVHAYKMWLQQDDMVIRDSIADILDWTEASVLTQDMVLFDGPGFGSATPMPDQLERVFLDCEWSDYACDFRPVIGVVVKKIFPPVPVNTHLVFPPLRASRWSARSDDEFDQSSLSDDDTPPSPRKWLRYQSWK